MSLPQCILFINTSAETNIENLNIRMLLTLACVGGAEGYCNPLSVGKIRVNL